MEKLPSQQAVIYLNTPLMYPGAKEEKGYPTLRLKVKIISKDSDGILVEIHSVAAGKGWTEGSPYGKKILIPIHKIDYISFE